MMLSPKGGGRCLSGIGEIGGVGCCIQGRRRRRIGVRSIPIDKDGNYISLAFSANPRSSAGRGCESGFWEGVGVTETGRREEGAEQRMMGVRKKIKMCLSLSYGILGWVRFKILESKRRREDGGGA